MSISKYIPVTATEFARNIKKYLDLIEQGKIIYIIRYSTIVAEVKSPDFKEVV